MKSLFFAACLAATSIIANAAPTELIVNGGFENGDLSGWTQANTNSDSGYWLTSNSSSLPYGPPTVGPATGSYYAVSVQHFLGAHVLEQSFTVAAGQKVSLSFDMFRNIDSNSAVINPAGLDESKGPNEHARVDILTSSASPFSIADSDLIAVIVAPGSDSIYTVNPYTHYTYDLSSALSDGGTYVLRFGEVDNQGYFNQGVDNVSLTAVEVVPEPETYAMMLAGLGGLGLVTRRRKTL